MPVKESINKILAIIVLYQVPLTDSITIQSLNKSLKKHNAVLDLFVYDNSPISLYSKTNFVFESFRVHYISNPKNGGISLAYNIGAEYAEQLNKQWLFLLDDDTDFSENSIGNYLKAINTIGEKIYLFAPYLYQTPSNILASPSYSFFRRGFISKGFKSGQHLIKHRIMFNSGLCVKLNAFKKIGGYNEKVRMYGSDYAFIYRYKRAYKYFYLLPIKAIHNSSLNNLNVSQEKILWRFSMFCEGNGYLAENIFEWFLYTLYVFLRTLKLSFKYHSTVFLCLFFKHYLFHQAVENKEISRSDLTTEEQFK